MRRADRRRRLFWRDVGSLRRHLAPEVAEIAGTIRSRLAAGILPTHIDAHMTAAMLPGMLDAHVPLARAHELFPVLPRPTEWAPDHSLRRYADYAFLATGGLTGCFPQRASPWWDAAAPAASWLG